jgi:hypothetical protein
MTKILCGYDDRSRHGERKSSRREKRDKQDERLANDKNYKPITGMQDYEI